MLYCLGRDHCKFQTLAMILGFVATPNNFQGHKICQNHRFLPSNPGFSHLANRPLAHEMPPQCITSYVSNLLETSITRPVTPKAHRVRWKQDELVNTLAMNFPISYGTIILGTSINGLDLISQEYPLLERRRKRH